MGLEAPQASNQKEYFRVAPCLYRHAKSGRYYGCKKVNGRHREHSLGTKDRGIAERRLKEWIDSFGKVDVEVERTTLGVYSAC